MLADMIIRRFIRLTLAALLVVAPSIAFAGYDEGAGALSSGDYTTAHQEFRTAAEAGDLRAFGPLGALVAAGLGTESDTEAGLDWGRRGVGANDPGAMFVYGSWLSNGSFVDRGVAHGANLLRRSAQGGVADAQAAIGGIYLMAVLSGAETTISAAEALHWTEMAAAADHPEGLYYLGTMSLTGMGAAQNIPLGRSWLIKAAKKGYTEAFKSLPNIPGTELAETYTWHLIASKDGEEFHTRKVKELATQLNPDEIATAHARAAAWEAANGGETDWPLDWPSLATVATATDVQGGAEGTSWPVPVIENDPSMPHEEFDVAMDAFDAKDHSAALSAFQAAAAAGDHRAFSQVGWILAVGLGVQPAVEDALRWVQRGVELDDPSALTVYGNWLLSGRFVERDVETGLGYLRRAAEAGYLDAQSNLSSVYSLAVIAGHEPPLLIEEGIHWTKVAAGRDDPNALNSMGFLYLNGLGVEQNMGEARKWFLKAAIRGDLNATTNLGLQAVDDDPAEAYKWFLISSRGGHGYATTNADEIVKQLSEEQIAAATQAADAWAVDMGRQSANTTDSPELMAIRRIIEAGSNENAINDLRSLADQGDARASILLGDLHMTGDGVSHNYSLAAGRYSDAAEADNADGQFKLSGMYRDNLGLPRNPDKVREWLIRAAETGHAEARQQLREQGVELPEIKLPMTETMENEEIQP